MIENIGLAGYKKPTPIQAYTFPAIYQGRDIVACAQTGMAIVILCRLSSLNSLLTLLLLPGSGKTAAFLIPIISKLMGKASKLAAKRPLFKRREEFDPKEHGVTAEPLVLIVAPTRELVTQIHHETLRFCYRSKLLPCAIYGGISVGDQVKELRRGCDILISTPGRLCHLMEKPEVLTLSRVRYVIHL
jgi:ATP-dependent RNA helicase DDX3X